MLEPRRTLFALALLAACSSACRRATPSHVDLTASPAPEPASMTLDGLHAPARIVTDRFGIPPLSAASLEDLYFVWGFVTARDRLWQIAEARQSARGELWRWVGNRALRGDGGAQL